MCKELTMKDRSPVRMLQHKGLHVRSTKERKHKQFKLKHTDCSIVKDHWNSITNKVLTMRLSFQLSHLMATEVEMIADYHRRVI
jgi:hypothetical protein